MESARLQREQTKSEPVSYRSQRMAMPATANSRWPLTLTDANSPALRLGHAFGSSHTPLPHVLHAKLTVNEPGDQYEQEADRVAEQVMRMPDTTLRLQRKCGCGGSTQSGESCEECANESAQLQRSAPSENSFSAATVPSVVHAVLLSSGQPLDQSTRAFFEPRFGHDFSHVRVHTDARASESAQTVNALAYTVGRNLVFARGRYAPGTPEGQRLLAHELAHTIQQQDVSTAPQPKLEVETANSPNEIAADRAADAVLRGQHVPTLSPSGSALSRQVAGRSSREERGTCHGDLGTALSQVVLPTASAPTGRYTISSVDRVSNNERRVHISTGQRYIVRRIPWTTTEEVASTTASARPGIDREQVWLDVEVCRGSARGRIRVGANVPDQVIQLILNTITSGGDVSAAWRAASITPAISGEFRFGNWQVNLSAQTTVDTSGRDRGVSGGASVEVDTREGRLHVGATGSSQQVGDNPFGGAQVGVEIRLDWGAPARPAPHCTTLRTRTGFSYECQEERDVAPQTRPGVQSVTGWDEISYNLFFQYAVTTFDDARNTEALAALVANLGTGYQVTRIEGWASPEGPMTPGRRFVGNDELSRQRAIAARDRIVGLCGAANCMAPGSVVVGLSERMDPTDDRGQPIDVAGRPLEQHVDQTFSTDPREASVQSRALMERLRRTPSLHARAEAIYPWLRRAVITLSNTTNRTDPCNYVVPGHTEEAYLSNCPDDIRRAAFPSP